MHLDSASRKIQRHRATGHQNADSFASAAQSRRHSGSAAGEPSAAVALLPPHSHAVGRCYSAQLALPTAHLGSRNFHFVSTPQLPNTTLRVNISRATSTESRA